MLASQQSSQGVGFRILTETVASPTLAAQLRGLVAQYPRAKWVQWEPVGRHNAREGSRLAFGEYADAQYAIEKATVILSLDADFLCTGAAGLKHARAFASRRRIEGDRSQVNRLYAVESTATNTGTRADHRLSLRASQIESFARALAAQLGVSGVAAAVPEAASRVACSAGQGSSGPSRTEHRDCGRWTAGGCPRTGSRDQRGARQRRLHRHVHADGGIAADEPACGVAGACGRDVRRHGRVPADPGRQPGLHRALGSELRRRDASGCRRAHISASTRTRRPRSANGTSPRRTSSKPGATCAQTTARRRLSSR